MSTINPNDPGIMVCARAHPGDTPLLNCGQCEAGLKISGFGLTRLLEFRYTTGRDMTILCNACGKLAMDAIQSRMRENPAFGASMEILPNALEAIADTDPELAKQLFRRDAETRDAERRENEKK